MSFRITRSGRRLQDHEQCEKIDVVYLTNVTAVHHKNTHVIERLGLKIKASVARNYLLQDPASSLKPDRF